MPAAEVPAEEALQGAEVPEEGAAGEGGADLVSMQVRAADTVTIRPRYGHDTVTIQVGYVTVTIRRDTRGNRTTASCLPETKKQIEI